MLTFQLTKAQLQVHEAVSAHKEAKEARDCAVTSQNPERRKTVEQNFDAACNALFHAEANRAHQVMKKKRLDEEGIVVFEFEEEYQLNEQGKKWNDELRRQ